MNVKPVVRPIWKQTFLQKSAATKTFQSYVLELGDMMIYIIA